MHFLIRFSISLLCAVVRSENGKALQVLHYENEDSGIPNDEFKLELDPHYLPNDPNRTPVAEVRQWYADYMRSLHDFLARRFDNYSPYWREQKVQWHFSAPTTWKNVAMKREIQEILGKCGFGLLAFRGPGEGVGHVVKALGR